MMRTNEQKTNRRGHRDAERAATAAARSAALQAVRRLLVAVKEQLKRAGYGPDQLYMLGNYKDPITADLVPQTNLQDTLRAAFVEYRFNAMYPRAGGKVEDPDGQIVTIYDEDAGF
jgi:hypothetical protein